MFVCFLVCLVWFVCLFVCFLGGPGNSICLFPMLCVSSVGFNSTRSLIFAVLHVFLATTLLCCNSVSLLFTECLSSATFSKFLEVGLGSSITRYCSYTWFLLTSNRKEKHKQKAGLVNFETAAFCPGVLFRNSFDFPVSAIKPKQNAPFRNTNRNTSIVMPRKAIVAEPVL